jgi:hypothetical protein
VKYYALVLTLSSVAFAQQATTYNYDVNGHRVEAVGSVNHTTVVRDANGRRVPVQKVEERVISDDGTTRVVERTVRQYSTDGRPAPPEKIRVEERKGAGGTITTATTTWRGDISGNLQLAERSVAETRTSGDTTSVATAIERPTMNGSMELVEKQEQITRTTPNKTSDSTSIYRKDANGRFDETARKTVETVSENGTVIENATSIELGRLVRQTVSRTVKEGDRERIQQDVFVADAPGKVTAVSEARPQLRERRLIDRTYTAGGSIETVSVQRPLANDPGRLSNPQRVEETQCTGKCGAPKNEPAVAQP